MENTNVETRKIMKTNLSKFWIFALVNIAVLAVPFSGAQAASQLIEGIRVSGLPAGQILNVFYATGRPPALDLGGTPILRSIKRGPVRVRINSNGQASLPSVSISRSGFDVANFVVFDVVSPEQEQVYVKNTDCTVPTDPFIENPERLDPSAYSSVATGYIDIVAFEKLRKAQGSSSVALVFGKDIKITDAPQQQQD